MLPAAPSGTVAHMTASHAQERHRPTEGTTPATQVGEVDVVVIGAGPTGENAAARAAAGGLSVALVEADLLGGECSFWACMPSKALLRPGQVLRAAQALPGVREAVTGALDVAAVLARRDSFASGYDDGSQVQWASGADIAVVRGRGRLTRPRSVEVTSDDGSTAALTARRAVVVATGSVASEPPIDGLDAVPHWGSREATSAKEVPRRLAVVGGGVVGAELATAFATLGAQVTLLTPSRLLGRFDPRVGELVAASLEGTGVDVRLGARVQRVEREGADGPVTVHVQGGDAVIADELLVATGRRPASADIGVEAVGLEPGEPLEVDTTGVVLGVDQGDGAPWLYAAGDVTQGAPLTHMGKYSARTTGDVIVARAKGAPVADGAWGKHATTAQQRAVPQVVFTSPEVASVGLSAAQADDAGLRTRVVELDLAVAGSALLADDYSGWAQMVVDEDRRVVVGVTFVGQDVGELLHSATIAVVGEVPLERLWHAVPSFPTVSEVWLRLLETYGL